MTSPRRALALLTGTHAVNDFYTGAIPPLLPFFVAQRGYDYAAVGGIALAATACSSVVQPVFGVWADRHRTGWISTAGMATAAIGVAVCGVTGGYATTCAALALSGIGVAAYHPEATRAARQAAGHSARALSWFSLGGNIGIALAPVAVAVVIGTYRLVATPLLAVPAAVMCLVLRAPRRRRPALAVSPVRPAGVPSASSTAHRPGGRDDWLAFRALLAVILARSVGTSIVTTFVALFVVRRFDQPTSVGALALGLLSGVGIGATLLGGWLADRLGRVRTLALAYALASAALAGLANAPDLPAALVALIVLGVAEYVPFSVQVTLGHDYLPRRIGTASGVTLGLGITVGGAFNPLAGLLADRLGLADALYLGVAALAVALLLALRLPEPSPAPPRLLAPSTTDQAKAVRRKP